LDTVTLIVQVDGKVRDRFEVPADIGEDEAAGMALASERVQAYLEGGDPARVITRPPKLVNVVTK
jgi:leucyl-tRNA synthetase